MKRLISLFLMLALMLALAVPVFAVPPSDLTWDGKPATFAEIAKNTGYDMMDSNGNYTPLYHYYAVELWSEGLFLGSNGSFDLDNPLTRAEGVVMTIRILGKEAEAKATAGSLTFTDVPGWATSYVAYAVENGIANGYSQATFGSNDPMTAAQFITLVLRAMGYEDGTDFTWDKSYDKALEIGLIGQPCHTQYSRSNLFLRDNAAVIAYNAVFKAPTKTGSLLRASITMPGKPAGAIPTAVRIQQNTPSTTFSDWDVITGDNYFTITSLPGNNYYAIANYFIYIGDYRGIIHYTVDLSPTAVGTTVSDYFDTTDADADAAYVRLRLGFNITPSKYGQNVTNTIKIKIGDYVYSDAITTTGTLYSMKII